MKRMFMGGAAAILGAAALAGCGSSEPESFDAEVLLSGNADKVVETGSVCTFAEGVVKPGIQRYSADLTIAYWAKQP
ncbi:hypothetical protein GS931_21310 [Rhodococcus hoagii]|nr:hypothetical protein [Prescottella equi]